MTLRSLVLCSDDKILRVLRRVLSDLEIAMDHCSDADQATLKLTRQRFEAVIVDCAEPSVASLVLKSARSAPCNKRAVAVAIIDGTTGVRSAFDMGAHFALYKPISMERAKTSFRAARALMKRERRRNSRLPLQIPVSATAMGLSSIYQGMTVDFSEGGMAVQFRQKVRESGTLRCVMNLPGISESINAESEIAWESQNNIFGVRFINTPPDLKHLFKTWVNQHCAEADKDDPPLRCRVTDPSLGGCYLEVVAPFPVRTRVTLTMRTRDLEVRADGIVRVVHPDAGMGVEFTQDTAEQRSQVKTFIHAMRENKDASAEFLVEPDGLDPDIPDMMREPDSADPLLELFRLKANVPIESFMRDLRKQRNQPTDATEIILDI